jgi:phage-related protein
MAKARFEYEINSRDKSKAGVDSAKRGVEGLGAATQKASNLMKAAFAGVSLVAITKGVQKVTQLYAEQQKVEIRLQAAINNNPMLNGDAAKRLTDYASALQQSSVYGDEQIIQQQSMLASLGMTEDKIKAVMDASVDLASSGMMSLESATRNIAKSFSGMTGELGEAIPALRDLTAEELKSGKAVEVIKEQFAGMGQAMADSVDGQIKQMKNTLGDIGETIGGALAPIGSAVINSLKPALDGIARWFTDNQTQIINFFTNLPEIGRVSLMALRDAISKILSWEYLKTLGQALWKYFLDAAQSALDFLASVLNAIGQTIWQPLKYGWDMMIYGIKQVFAEFINWFVDKINWVVAQGKKVGLFGKTETLDRAGGSVPRPDFAGDEIKDAWAEAGSAFTDHMTNVFEAATTLGEEIGGPLGGVFEKYLPQFQEILVRPITGTSPVGSSGGAGTGDAATGESRYNQDRSAHGAGTGGIQDAKVPSELGKVFSSLTDGLGPLITSLSSFTMIMDPLGTILKGVMDVLGPLIDSLLQPLIGILTIVGQTIGKILAPALELLKPIIDAIARVFVFLYNYVVRPVYNTLMTVFNGIYNAFASFVNGILALVDAIPFVDVGRVEYRDKDYGHLDKITLEGVNEAGEGAINSTETGSGGGANYTAGRTINQEVNIYTDVISGEGGIRELALMIRDEIYSAEALGA